MQRIRIARSVVAFVGWVVFGVVFASAGLPNLKDIPLERIDESDEPQYRDRMPIYAVEEYGSPWITDDRNGDGQVDYAVLFNEYFEKVIEAVDYGHDGLMDDFYYYHEGNLVRQEIDTNHDGAVDLWIYLDGAYVERWERDTNHDGKPDQVREY